MWKTCFSASQNAKNESQLKHKNQVRNRIFIDSYVFEFEGLYLSLRGEHIKTKFYINFNKINVKFYWQLCLRVWRIILVITWCAHKRQTFTLISIKFMWILKFFVYKYRVFKHKGFFSNQHFCCNGLGKMWDSYIFHFLKGILTSTHMKKFNIFCII